MTSLERALLIAAALCVAACPKPRREPGFEERSADGGTLLEVDTDCGGQPVWVDGKRWPAGLGIPLPVPAGRHVITCGDRPDAGPSVDVTVHDGSTFHIKFWGLGE